MIKMDWASPADKNDIIDFCDYIFSKYHRPHDFATLLLKLYGEKGDSIPHHFIIREDGNIVAAIVAYPVEMHIGSHTFQTIGVGSVSVHPRAKGRGYMKYLLDAVDEHAREHNAMFAFLDGQRQRYGYFGYKPAGYHMNARLSPNNVRHALSDACDEGVSILPMRDEDTAFACSLNEKRSLFCTRTPENFRDIAASWYFEPTILLKGEDRIGYAILKPDQDSVTVSELCLSHEADLPAVLKKLSGRYGIINLTVSPFEKERAQFLTGVCEGWQIARNHMFKFYDEAKLRGILKKAGLPHDLPLSFDGFTLPLPLFISAPDAL
ncbi:MAG: GNAT family N-acetyltransferase [Clostridiales bacterium]|nr:GNAT family N-acetyltransferase [Clostridiales bacterium]